MLNIERRPDFLRKISKIKDNILKEQIKKQVDKIVRNPEVGKPMRYSRKETREVYVKPFRLSYSYLRGKATVVFLDLYHKKKQ